MMKGETDRTRFNKCCSYAHNRDEKDAGSVVIILVYRPQQETCNLEDIEGVECLFKGLERTSHHTQYIPHQRAAEELSSA